MYLTGNYLVSQDKWNLPNKLRELIAIAKLRPIPHAINRSGCACAKHTWLYGILSALSSRLFVYPGLLSLSSIRVIVAPKSCAARWPQLPEPASLVFAMMCGLIASVSIRYPHLTSPISVWSRLARSLDLCLFIFIVLCFCKSFF